MAGRKKIVNLNVGPRTPAARRAVILMNRIKHRPKSVPIQTDTEIVVQVRGEFDHIVKKLKKVFKSKGKDTTTGNFRTHEWKLKGLGFLSVLHRDPNPFSSVRFVNVPGLGIKQVPEEQDEAAEAAKKATEALATSAVPQSEEDLDAVLLD